MKAFTDHSLQRWFRLAILVLAGLALLLPLLYVNWSYYVSFPRAALFQCAVEMMLGAWLLSASVEPGHRPRWRDPLVIALVVYAAFTLVTLPLALDPARAFWSSMSRMSGWLNQAHYWIWCLVLASVATERDLRRLAWFSTAVCVVVDVIGLAQVTNPPWNGRIVSVFVNPGFLSAYVLPHVFLAGVLFFTARDRRWRQAALAAAAMHLVTLMLSGTRASFVGMLVGLGFWLLWLKLRGRRRLAALSLLFLAVLGFAVWSSRPTESATLGSGAASAVGRLATGSGDSGRASLWAIALAGIAERPIFGWGGESYGYVFDRHVDFGTTDAALTDNWFDRAHDFLLDGALDHGLVGLALLLVFWSLAFYRLLRRGHGSGGVAPVGLASLLLANLFQLAFSFEMPMSNMVVYLALAYGLVLVPWPEKPAGRRPVLTEARAVYLAVPVVFGMLTLAYQVNLLPLLKSVATERAATAALLDRAQATDGFADAFKGSAFVDFETCLRATDTVNLVSSQILEPSRRVEDLARLVAAQAALCRDRRPEDYRLAVNFATAERQLMPYDDSARDRAEAAARGALAMAPNRPEAYEELAEITAAAGEYRPALAWLQQSMERSPRRIVPRLIFRSATFAALAGDLGMAKERLSESWIQGFEIDHDVRLALPIARLVSSSINDRLAFAYIDLLARRLPGNPYVLQAQALAYHRAGDQGRSREAYDRLKAAFPNAAASISEELEE